MSSRIIKPLCTVLPCGRRRPLAGLHTFQARYLRPFDNQATLFDGSQLHLPPELAGPGPIRVVHFWDPACPCNVGNQQHLGDLVSQFAGQGVTFHVLQKPGSHGQLPANLAALNPHPPARQRAPARPRPWRSGTGKGDWLRPLQRRRGVQRQQQLHRTDPQGLARRPPGQASNTLAVGCYCPWAG
jgi:hypothetical protein